MRKLVLCLVGLWHLHGHAGIGAEMLAVAKIAGLCGTFHQMVDFQKKTKIEGGDNFVYRFALFEAARMGKTPEELLGEDCPKAVEAYDKYWALIVEAEAKN